MPGKLAAGFVNQGMNSLVGVLPEFLLNVMFIVFLLKFDVCTFGVKKAQVDLLCTKMTEMLAKWVLQGLGPWSSASLILLVGRQA